MIDLPPPSYEQTIEAITHCDIPRANIHIKYQDYLQSDEVTISDLGPVTDAKLRCLKGAVHPFYILTIENPAQQAAFYEFSEREDRPKRKAEAREWLQSKRLLNRVPTYDPKRGLPDFAVSLEAACGLKPGSVLMADGDWLTVRPNALSAKSFEKSSETLACVTRMFAASDASEKGVKFGFIGNEAVAEKDKK